jgi:dynein heavy chain
MTKEPILNLKDTQPKPNKKEYKQIKDTRINWIKQKVQCAFENEFEIGNGPPEILSKHPEVEFEPPPLLSIFEECMYTNNGTNLCLLENFLDDKQETHTALIFWTEKVIKSLQVPINVEIVDDENQQASEVVNNNSINDHDQEEPQKLTESLKDTKKSMEILSSSGSNNIGSKTELAASLSDDKSDNLNRNANENHITSNDEESADKRAKITKYKTEIVSINYEVIELRMTCKGIPENIAETNAIYFLRNKNGAITISEIDDYLELGFISNQAILMLEQVINFIYLPMLASTNFKSLAGHKESNRDEAAEDKTDESAVNSKMEQMKAEVLVTLQRFSSQIAHTVQQVAGETSLKIPDELVEIDKMDEQEVLADQQKLAKIDALAEEWIETVARALQKEAQKVPNGNGPLAEIELWRNKSSSLSTLYEQLTLPIVPKIVKIINMAQMPNSALLEFQLAELNKIYSEAKDNVKFLSTLERHFKNIVVGSLCSVEV